MSGHVTGASGIGVVPPGPPDVLGLLEDDKVVTARLLERDSHTQSRKAGTDDDDPGPRHRRGGARVGGGHFAPHRETGFVPSHSARMSSGTPRVSRHNRRVRRPSAIPAA